MSKFLTGLDIALNDNGIWVLRSPLIYQSDILCCDVEAPTGFQTDLASVPRLPIVYWFWGGRVHREAVIHDYLFRIDSFPVVSFSLANAVFLEAAESRGKSLCVRYPMFWGVCVGGRSSYHKHLVMDKL